MKRFRNRFLIFWLCVLLNVAGTFGYAQNTVLCLKEGDRHALESSTDGYQCHSSTAMSEAAYRTSDKGEIPPTQEHCGSCLDIPLSAFTFDTNISSTRPTASDFDSAMPVHLFRVVNATGNAIEGGDPLSPMLSDPTYTSLRSTVLLI